MLVQGWANNSWADVLVEVLLCNIALTSANVLLPKSFVIFSISQLGVKTFFFPLKTLFYLFESRITKKEVEIFRKVLHHWFISQITTTAKIRWERNQGTRNFIQIFHVDCRSKKKKKNLAYFQLLFSSTLARCCTGNRSARTLTAMSTWHAGIRGGGIWDGGFPLAQILPG